MNYAYIYSNSRDDMDDRIEDNCLVLKAYYGVENKSDYSVWNWGHKHLSWEVVEDQLRATHSIIDAMHIPLRSKLKRL